MANHKSSLKRIRQSESKRVHNKFYARSTRNAIKKLRGITDKSEAGDMLSKVESMLDKLAKVNIIHKNKASNIKSGLVKHVNSL